MPNPVFFSAPITSRTSGITTLNPLLYPGGFVSINSIIGGLGSGAGSDYENPANSIAFQIRQDPTGGSNFLDFGDLGWKGGPLILPDKGIADPPPNLFQGLANLTSGANISITVSQKGNFTWGLSGSIN